MLRKTTFYQYSKYEWIVEYVNNKFYNIIGSVEICRSGLSENELKKCAKSSVLFHFQFKDDISSFSNPEKCMISRGSFESTVGGRGKF